MPRDIYNMNFHLIKYWLFRGDFVNFQGYCKCNCNLKKFLWHNCAVPGDKIILEMWLFKGIVKHKCNKLNLLFATWVHFRWKGRYFLCFNDIENLNCNFLKLFGTIVQCLETKFAWKCDFSKGSKCIRLNFLVATWVHFRWKAQHLHLMAFDVGLGLLLTFFFPFLRLSLILMRFLGLSLFVSKENLRSLKGHKSDPKKGQCIKYFLFRYAVVLIRSEVMHLGMRTSL